jgi:type VI secretion system secreted protein Hcp
MPSDCYLLIKGVSGESQAANMTNNIELESWSFSARNEPYLGGKGLAAGKAALQDFSCSFSLDSASVQILYNLCAGTHIETVTFTGRKTGGGETPYTYLVVTLTNCMVTSFSTGGVAAGTPAANLALAFQVIQYQYYTQDTVSGSVTLAGQSQYDIKQVQAS